MDQAPSGETQVAEPPRKRRVAPRIRVGAVIALAAAIGVVVWLVVKNRDTSPSTTQKSTVAAISQRGLKTLAATFSSPIYWGGPQSRTTYELTQTPSGRIFVRYLPTGTPVGTSKRFLFVGTFPVRNAFAVTRKVANEPGSVKIPLGQGAVAFYSRKSATNIYLAFRGSNYQIEVFDPNPAQARRLVKQGQIQSVASNGQVSPQPTVVGASLARLKALPNKLGHPVFWTGKRSGVTYELTQTATGRVFIRYLPAGVAVGSKIQYPFVATFPVPNAFKVTQSAAKGASAVEVPVAGGAVAFYASATPTNVYLAFPGSDFQIEVFDPNPAHARAVVHSGRVTPIP